MDKPAFPSTEVGYDAYGAPTVNKLHDGLTRRELLAGMAMQGWCANGQAFFSTNDELAKSCVACADALITALDAEPPK